MHKKKEKEKVQEKSLRRQAGGAARRAGGAARQRTALTGRLWHFSTVARAAAARRRSRLSDVSASSCKLERGGSSFLQGAPPTDSL